MLPIDVIRAWKDEDYRRGLSAEQLAQLPAHPAGGIEVHQSDRVSFEAGRHTESGHGLCNTRRRGCV
jgi:mersacidin/lichenicidin family type 2 lantibiotic